MYGVLPIYLSLSNSHNTKLTHWHILPHSSLCETIIKSQGSIWSETEDCSVLVSVQDHFEHHSNMNRTVKGECSQTVTAYM